MLSRQVTHDDLGYASYLVGDEGAGIAAVVEPRFEIDVSLDPARYNGVRIEHILETHNRADHLSGHGRRPRARSTSKSGEGALVVDVRTDEQVVHDTGGGVGTSGRAGRPIERAD